MSDFEAKKHLVSRFLQAMSEGDIQTFLDACAEDGYVHTMGNTLI